MGIPFGDEPDAGQPGRSLSPVVLALAMLLVAAVAVGVTLVVTRDSDDQVASDRTGSTTDPAPSATPGPSDPAPASGSSTSTEASTPTTSTPPPPGAVCWDGSTAASVSDCSRPQGLAGLRYVFPDAASPDCTDITGVGDAAGRKLLVQCFRYLPDGTEIKINYSQWGAVSNAVDHYAGKGLFETEEGGFYVFTGTTGSGEANLAGVYVKEPFSASVYAPTQAALSQVSTVITPGRAPDQVRGEPVG